MHPPPRTDVYTFRHSTGLGVYLPNPSANEATLAVRLINYSCPCDLTTRQTECVWTYVLHSHRCDMEIVRSQRKYQKSNLLQYSIKFKIFVHQIIYVIYAETKFLYKCLKPKKKKNNGGFFNSNFYILLVNKYTIEELIFPKC